MEMPSGEGEELFHRTLSLSWLQSPGRTTSSKETSLVPAIYQWPFILNFVDRGASEIKEVTLARRMASLCQVPSAHPLFNYSGPPGIPHSHFTEEKADAQRG